MENNVLLSKLDGFDSRFEEVSTLITDPDVIADRQRYVKLTKEYRWLRKLLDAANDYRALLNETEEAKTILAEDDDEFCYKLDQYILDHGWKIDLYNNRYICPNCQEESCKQ